MYKTYDTPTYHVHGMTMEISGPHLLVRLPRTARPDASTNIGSVYALRGGLKRRRKEICAAIDGDSLSIYEVQDYNLSC